MKVLLKKESKKIIVYGSIYLILITVFVFAFRELFDMEQSIGDEIVQIGHGSFHKAVDIIYNNLKNFIGYFLIYPMYPVMYVKDLIFTSWAVAVSFHMWGVKNTFLLLIPHGMIEIPNFILFTYLSFANFKAFWTEKDMTGKAYVARIWRYRHGYILCFALLIIAGMIEGVVTKEIYELLAN